MLSFFYFAVAEKVAEKYVDKLKVERANFDQRQLGEIRTSIKDLLSDWSSKLNDAMEQQQQQLTQLRSQKNVDQTAASSSMDVVVGDIRERQAKMVQAIQDAHHRQIEILKAAIADERKESAQAQMVTTQPSLLFPLPPHQTCDCSDRSSSRR